MNKCNNIPGLGHHDAIFLDSNDVPSRQNRLVTLSTHGNKQTAAAPRNTSLNSQWKLQQAIISAHLLANSWRSSNLNIRAQYRNISKSKWLPYGTVSLGVTDQQPWRLSWRKHRAFHVWKQSSHTDTKTCCDIATYTLVSHSKQSANRPLTVMSKIKCNKMLLTW